MNGVLGVLNTERGITIKNEILENLKDHNLLSIEQEPPGQQFEYPAIKHAITTAIELKEPILYLHTKGAANEIPPIHKNSSGQSIATFMPPNATLKDWQHCVRKMWYNEFGNIYIYKYLNAVKGERPIVACPYTSSNKATWFNGFIMNPSAASELQKVFKLTTNRYWYEVMFNECPNVEVKGLILNTDNKADIYKSIWSFI